MTKRSFVYKCSMVIFDILAVNISYFVAFYLRFYIAYEFKGGSQKFIGSLCKILPFYTVACIIIFALFRMYRVLWKEAGLRDLNRILASNILCGAVFAAISLLCRKRMPLSMYFIGPVMQLGLIAVSRLSIKLILMERDHILQQKNATGNALVVGAQYLGQAGIRQIDHSSGFLTKCIIDTRKNGSGHFQNGIPIIGGIENIESAINQYGINYVLIADSFITDEEREHIKSLCRDRQITVADYTGYIENGTDTLSLTRLLQSIDGQVIIAFQGQETTYATPEEAMQSMVRRYLVRSISAAGKTIRIEIIENPLIPNDTNEAWVEEYKQDTGDDVSFF